MAAGGYRGGAATAAAAPQAAGNRQGEAASGTEHYSYHGQVTFVPQGHPGFRAPYSGPESLPSNNEVKENFAATAFLGLGLWQGAAVYVAPEIDQGFGVGNTF